MKQAAIVTALALSFISLPVAATAKVVMPAAPRLQAAADKAPAKAPEEAEKVAAEVLVIHGTKDGKGIDARLKHLVQLQKEPLNQYGSYQLLKSTSLPLKVGEGDKLELPNKGTLKVRLKEVVRDGKAPRYVVAASISKPGGKKFLPVLQVSAKLGHYFFVAGPKHDKGILVIAIRIVPAKK